jgi:DNA invertase Pin-like site-specific DNA recombinase
VGVYFHDDECVDLNVSGGLAADDRKLGRLIERCESGELGGIIVRYEDRFARDVVAGGVALARLVECGARLIATATGFDSEHLTPDKEMVFNIMMSVGQAQRKRNLEARMRGKARAAARGVHCAPRPPFGYDRVHDAGIDGKKLVPNEHADVLREIFRLRADGLGFKQIADRVSATKKTDRDVTITHSGVRKVIRNRSYLGEQRVPDPDRKGELKVFRDVHPPLITENQWEAANAVEGKAPTHNGASKEARLHGIVRCGECGKRMSVQRYGKAEKPGKAERPEIKDRPHLTYACTTHGCRKASLSARKLEPDVLQMLDTAILNREPHVAAVIEGDDRYQCALDAVEGARTELETYRAEVKVSDVGAAAWKRDVQIRQEAIDAARRALGEVPRPDIRPNLSMSKYVQTDEEKAAGLIPAAADLADRRLFYARVIAEVRVYPRTAEHRLTLRWQGSDQELAVPPRPEAADLAQLVSLSEGVRRGREPGIGPFRVPAAGKTAAQAGR